jgi:predicted O-methyltransferase YrrM
VAATLDRLHGSARGDRRHGLGVLPRYLLGRLRGRSMMQALTPTMLRHMYLPVSRKAGELLYVLARAVEARRVLEFGTSFGISTVYLAAAVRDNGGGRVITTEIESSKCRAAEANLRDAGLDNVVTVLAGDALTTLRNLDGEVDLLFLDGWKDLYLPVLELVMPSLRSGALVIADNVGMKEVRPYLSRVRAGDGFFSARVSDGRMECSVYAPAGAAG